MASAEAKPAAAKPTEETKVEEPQKPAAVVGEDDEFEDFPVDDWAPEDAEAAEGAETKHLWEESWDDDDTSDDFSAQLREEIRKVEASKKR